MLFPSLIATSRTNTEKFLITCGVWKNNQQHTNILRGGFELLRESPNGGKETDDCNLLEKL